MCPSLALKSKKERSQESFQPINTSNLSNIYSTSLKSFRLVVYDVSSIVSKNRNVSDGKLLPINHSYSGPPNADNITLFYNLHSLYLFATTFPPRHYLVLLPSLLHCSCCILSMFRLWSSKCCYLWSDNCRSISVINLKYQEHLKSIQELQELWHQH